MSDMPETLEFAGGHKYIRKDIHENACAELARLTDFPELDGIRDRFKVLVSTWDHDEWPADAKVCTSDIRNEGFEVVSIIRYMEQRDEIARLRADVIELAWKEARNCCMCHSWYDTNGNPDYQRTEFCHLHKKYFAALQEQAS